MSNAVLDFAVDTLASYRLTKLDDFITAPVRDAVQAHAGPPDRSKLSYLIHCPWCLSVYFGIGLTLARRRAPVPTDLLVSQQMDG